MSDIEVPGFKSSTLVAQIADAFSKASPAEKQEQIKKTKGIFELEISDDKDKTKKAIWTIDLKNKGEVYKGPAKPKADVTIIMTDTTFNELASGKLNGQKAFMTGKLKTKGNMMLATKLDSVLKASKAKL